ncbi:MAG: hypothetical protein A2046_00485 [Bacteroidetes bacterium GWA2_30_7]|nr:MAG: hypothetical protein A2046_00485 [Bacteroidetes bacterium GWA2_30_7]
MANKEYIKLLDKSDIDRLRLKIKTDKGKVKDIVVQYESFIIGKWTAIVRYDCNHGFFHRDLLQPNGDKEKQAISINNLEDALYYAEQDLKDRWEFYKEKYLKKIKK